MKMKYVAQKIREERKQCSLCAARFEIWLDNSRLNDEKREKIEQRLLSYCPVCSRVSEK